MSVSSLRSFEYLESLPGTVFNRLYKQPSTALAIFRRMLPHLGRSRRLYDPTTLADRSSEELCYGLVVSQPAIISDESRILGSSG